MNASAITGTISAGQIGSVNASSITGQISSGQISSVSAGSITGSISANQIGSLNGNVININTIDSTKITSIAAGVFTAAAANITGYLYFTSMNGASSGIVMNNGGGISCPVGTITGSLVNGGTSGLGGAQLSGNATFGQVSTWGAATYINYMKGQYYSVAGNSGKSGSFVAGGKTIWVENGIIVLGL